MQETQTSKPSVGAIVAIVGGVMLAIGSFLTWATVSLDTTALIDKLAEALGVTPDQLGDLPTDDVSNSVSGWDGSDGKITLVVGVIIILAAIIILAKPRLRVAMGAVVIVAGLVGGGVAAYDASQVKDVASDAEEAAAATAGLSAGDLEGAFDVTAGVGLWVCIAGGVIALIGGVLALRERQAATSSSVGTTTMTAAPAAPATTGFDAGPAPASPASPTPAPQPVTEPPPAPVAPPTPSAPESPPATPAPAPPPTSTEGDAPGDSGAPPN